MTDLPVFERLQYLNSGSRNEGPCPTRSEELDTIYETYHPLLRRIALRKFGLPREDVDDMVHEVFTSFLERTYVVENVHKYLIGAICNASRQYWRRKDATRAVFCDADACVATPDSAMVEEVIRTLAIQGALSKLAPRCRQTLYDYYWQGESAANIAIRQGTTEKYIGRLLYECRRRVKAMYLARKRKICAI